MIAAASKNYNIPIVDGDFMVSASSFRIFTLLTHMV